jgi:EAL domain-containing protein (putative c-di-GMP-specific phosphodiesterase class I)
MKLRKKHTRWLLEQVSDASEKWMIAIEPFPFTVGRDEDCNLALQSKWVSRHHAEIQTSGGLLWIRDLGSTNGTFVNHNLIQESELLEPGDVISFGKSHFCLKSADANRAAGGDETVSLDLTEDLNRLVSLEPKLRKLLRERNVIPHFQPIVRFFNPQAIGYEILGRISEDDLLSDPVELFEVAAYMVCASDLSALFRETGVDWGRRLPDSPLLFANTDPAELDRLDVLMESLERTHEMAPSNRIVLEINERAVPHTDEMTQFRDRLADLDIALAFDDFGVGQTRLVELAKMPPDFLKFDISLIRQIHLAPKRLHQMVLTFVKAAHDLGIKTVAEGIECQDEGETCRQLGFEYAQGYFYGRPSPIGAFALPKTVLSLNGL